jgi:hypothetical protein
MLTGPKEEDEEEFLQVAAGGMASNMDGSCEYIE